MKKQLEVRRENRGKEKACDTELPDECIVNILSRTTPPDACRVALVSKNFRVMADSDTVWIRFIPSDYLTILSLFDDSSNLDFVSKKELYLDLCFHARLFDGGKKSFSLDIWSGKKCYMIAARDLTIAWGDTPKYWRWSKLSHSRFGEVAELIDVCWFDILGKINTAMLSPQTTYAAYLVCKFTKSSGFDHAPVNVSVGIMGGESCMRIVYLEVSAEWWPQDQTVPRRAGLIRDINTHQSAPQPYMPRRWTSPYPNKRGLRWLQVELGEYFNKGEEDEELRISLSNLSGAWKHGLIIQGIEIRPKRVINRDAIGIRIV